MPSRRIVDRSPSEEHLWLLRTAVEHGTESVIITTTRLDPPGPHIVYVNPAFTRMTGYAADEVIGKTPRLLQGPKTDRAVLERLRTTCAAGEVFVGEIINYRKDGSEYCVELRVRPVRDERGEVTHLISTQRDVTERRRVEDELRRSEHEFRSLFQLSAIGMTKVSPTGRYLHVNQKLCEMLGYSEDELLQLTLHDVTHPDDREFSAASLDSSFARAPEEHSIEKRYVRKDGSVILVSIKWKVIPDEAGTPLHTVAIIQDITASRCAEEALRANESQLRAILDNSTTAIFIKDLDGRYLRVNRWYETLRGLPEAQVKGRTDDDLYPKEIAEAFRANDRQVIAADAPLQFEEEVALPDGPRHVISVKFPLHDDHGRPYAVCGISTDITDRKRTEEALRASEERFRSLITQASDAIFVTDLEGVYTDVNSSACRMLGYAPDELVGMKAAALLPREDVVKLAALRESLLKGDVHRGEWRLRHKDGHYVPVELSAKMFRPGRGVAIVRDIQRRKQVEAEREGLLAREQAAREAAEAANRSKDEFLAVVSHELRSPLNAMLGYARLLRRGPLDPQKVEEAAEAIERNGTMQVQLIEDLLDTARIISGKLRLEVRPLDLVDVIREAVQTISPAAVAKGISLATDLPPRVSQITGDAARLRQVVWNVLSNAIKFTPAGGQVQVRLKRVDPHVCLTVSDTGIGISPDFLPYVFDRFWQADASSARRYAGLGLGLSLVKYLVELHGGTVQALSPGEGQGATFNVLLPVRAVSAPRDEFQREASAVSGGERVAILAGLRALVVDDDDDARELLRSVIAQYGGEVVAARSAAEAYVLVTAAAERERPDVMVTDLGMPDEDGYSLLRRVRAWGHAHDVYIPAVALTGYARTEDRVRALIAGFQMHVAKPVEPAELAAVIASLARRPEGHGAP